MTNLTMPEPDETWVPVGLRIALGEDGKVEVQDIKDEVSI